MISAKTIIIEIFKPEDYAPLPRIKRHKIIMRITSEIYALAKFNGNRAKAAEHLGISVPGLIKMLKKK